MNEGVRASTRTMKLFYVPIHYIMRRSKLIGTECFRFPNMKIHLDTYYVNNEDNELINVIKSAMLLSKIIYPDDNLLLLILS